MGTAKNLVENDSKWKIFWGQVKSIEKERDWFSILPRRSSSDERILLVIDDPSEFGRLEDLEEKMALDNRKNWKLLIVVRTAQKETVQHSFREESKELKVKNLPRNDALELCREFIRKRMGKRCDTEKAAQWIAKRYDYVPIWIVLAICYWQEHGKLAYNELPKSKHRLIERYVDEWVKYCSRRPRNFNEDKVHEFLHWLALMSPINKEDQGELDFLSDKVGLESNQAIDLLKLLYICGGVKRSGGYDHWHEIKPDIVRDEILQNWLTIKGEANAKAKNIVEEVILKVLFEGKKMQSFEGPEWNRARKILNRLFQIDRVLMRDRDNAGLLKEFWQEVKERLPTLSPNILRDLLEVLKSIAQFYPGEAESLLESERPGSEARLVLWKILVEVVRNIRVAIQHGTKYLIEEETEHLRWMHDILQKESPSLQEAGLVREIWQWHIHFGKDGEQKELAKQCDKLLIAKIPQVALHIKFFDSWNRPGGKQLSNDELEGLAKELAKKPEEIDSFFADAITFVSELKRFIDLPLTYNYLVLKIGKNITEDEARYWLKERFQLGYDTNNYHYSIARGWVTKKESPPLRLMRVKALLKVCGDEVRKRLLISECYWGLVFHDQVSKEEYEFLRSSTVQMIFAEDTYRYIYLIGGSFDINWDFYRDLVEKILQRDKDTMGTLLRQWMHSIEYKTDKDNSVPNKDALCRFILTQFVRQGEFDPTGTLYFRNIGKKIGWKLPCAFLLKVILKEGIIPRVEYYGQGVHELFQLIEYENKVELKKAMSELVKESVDISQEKKKVKNYFRAPKFIKFIDPEADFLPNILSEQTKKNNISDNIPALIRYARFGTNYELNSEPWRRIAKVFLRLYARAQNREEWESHIWFALTEAGGVSFSGDAEDYAKSNLAQVQSHQKAEKDPLFEPIWADLVKKWKNRIEPYRQLDKDISRTWGE